MKAPKIQMSVMVAQGGYLVELNVTNEAGQHREETFVVTEINQVATILGRAQDLLEAGESYVLTVTKETTQ